MKVVAYVHAYPGSGFMAGGETTLHDLLKTLVVAGHDVELILSEAKTDGSTNDYVIDGVQVRAFTDVKQPNRAIPSADLVISHLGGSQRASLIARQHGVPSIHLIHNDLTYTKVMSKHAQYLVYNTLWVLDSFRKSGIDRPPGMVVRPPVDPTSYLVDSERTHITLVNLADGDGGPYDKGPGMFYKMAERFPEEKFLGVVGAYGNQDIRRDYPNVEFMDNTEDARNFYRRTKVVLSPSNYESYGRISLEAACSGIPSITSKAPGFVEHAVGYRLVDYRDVDGWETALRSLLRPTTYDSASIEAEQKALALWEQSKRELEEFVSECERVARTLRKKPRR